jgi:phage terminase small subunit
VSDVPGHLPADVAKVWREVRARYEGHRDPAPEGPELEAYCGLVVRLRDAQQRIQDEGMLVPDGKGNAIPHPALAIERAASAELKRWEGKFTPRRKR